VPADEAYIVDAIILATDEVAGNGKGISNTASALVVNRKWQRC
jgi:hypothetical protein